MTYRKSFGPRFWTENREELRLLRLTTDNWQLLPETDDWRTTVPYPHQDTIRAGAPGFRRILP